LNACYSPPKKYAARTAQADKIEAILRDFLGRDIHQLRTLDLGCSNGIITRQLAPQVGWMLGADVDRAALQQAAGVSLIEPGKIDQIAFVLADGTRLPVPDASFDVVICAQVYEHTEDQASLPGEIWRVLRPGGVCFFSGPNRLTLMEEHYWLPLLSWFPKTVSDAYMRLFRKGPVYDIKPMYLWQLRTFWRQFICHDYTLRLIKEPQHFSAKGKLGRLGWISKLPAWVLQFLIMFVPNYNWILEKPS
jgi:SAM-dependent methyltransferase